MADVLLGLGSNLGDSRRLLRDGLKRLDDVWRLTAVSSVWKTEPVGYEDQDWFLNIAARGETELKPEEMLGAIEAIEAFAGRHREIVNGPRTLDIDILLYGDRTVESGRLTIPHQRMCERRFVLAPAAEIAGEMRHPGRSSTVADLLARLEDPSEVALAGEL